MNLPIFNRNKYETLLQQYKLAVKSANVGMWCWNIQTGETLFDDRWAEIIGYTLDEIDSHSIKTWTDFAHPDDLALSQASLERHFAGETEFYEIEARMR